MFVYIQLVTCVFQFSVKPAQQCVGVVVLNSNYPHTCIFILYYIIVYNILLLCIIYCYYVLCIIIILCLFIYSQLHVYFSFFVKPAQRCVHVVVVVLTSNYPHTCMGSRCKPLYDLSMTFNLFSYAIRYTISTIEFIVNL